MWRSIAPLWLGSATERDRAPAPTPAGSLRGSAHSGVATMPRITQSPLLLKGCSFRCSLRLRGIWVIHANLWIFRHFGLAVFRASHLVRLQLAGFLAPAIIGSLG